MVSTLQCFTLHILSFLMFSFVVTFPSKSQPAVCLYCYTGFLDFSQLFTTQFSICWRLWRNVEAFFLRLLVFLQSPYTSGNVSQGIRKETNMLLGLFLPAFHQFANGFFTGKEASCRWYIGVSLPEQTYHISPPATCCIHSPLQSWRFTSCTCWKHTTVQFTVYTWPANGLHRKQ